MSERFGLRVLRIVGTAFAGEAVAALLRFPEPQSRGIQAIEAELATYAGPAAGGGAAAGTDAATSWRDPAKARAALQRLLVAHTDTLAGATGYQRRCQELEARAKRSVLELIGQVEKTLAGAGRKAEEARAASAGAAKARKAVDEEIAKLLRERAAEQQRKQRQPCRQRRPSSTRISNVGKHKQASWECCAYVK